MFGYFSYFVLALWMLILKTLSQITHGPKWGWGEHVEAITERFICLWMLTF